MNNTRKFQERDCAVCLQKCYYPTQLPCGHVFCFLCAKGVAITNKKCAMCRAVIPDDYLDHPDVLALSTPQVDEEYQWYYEGGNGSGWWKYEERHNSDLEAAYNGGDTQCKLLIAGALYCIDFRKLMQYQCRDPSRRRHVRRDTPMLPAKGIAGIKIESRQRPETKRESESTNDSNQDDGSDEDDIPQNVNGNSVSSLDNEILQRMRAMGLQQRDRYGSASSRDSGDEDL